MNSRTFCIVTVFVVGIMPGCTTSSKSNTARTATEQLLISNSVDQVLDRTNFTPFADRLVFLETSYLDSLDKNYIIGSIRHRLIRAGAILVKAADQSEVVVEVRSGALGTDTTQSFVGVPELVVPGVVTLPEVRLLTRNAQQATAKIGLVAYETKTMRLLGEGGVSVGQSNDRNWFVMGVGPYRSGSVSRDIENANRASRRSPKYSLPSQIAFAHPQTAKSLAKSGEPIKDEIKGSSIQFTSAVEETENRNATQLSKQPVKQ